jgi:hypothetical protein
LSIARQKNKKIKKKKFKVKKEKQLGKLIIDKKEEKRILKKENVKAELENDD